MQAKLFILFLMIINILRRQGRANDNHETCRYDGWVQRTLKKSVCKFFGLLDLTKITLVIVVLFFIIRI